MTKTKVDPARARVQVKRVSTGIFRILCYLLLIDLAFVFLYPFLYMVVTSIKTYGDINNLSVNWIPTSFHWENYVIAGEAMKIQYSILNSVIVTGLATLGHLLSCTFIGYGFARFDFPFKRMLFFGVILSATIPIQTMIVPFYITYTNLGMIDTYLPLIIPTYLGFGLRGGIFIFLFRQYFLGFPKSLEEAALIDGCGRIRSFFRIALPSAGPSVIVCLVLSMVWHWNDYYEPSVYMSVTEKSAMVPQMLPNLYNWISNMPVDVTGSSRDLELIYHEGVVMAATAIAIAPLLIAYAFLQKKFMQSVERSGLVG